MKSLISSPQPSLYLLQSSPSKPKRPTFRLSSLPSSNNGRETRNPDTIKTKGKGFGNLPTITDEESSATKNSNNNGEEEIPQVVFERMLVRIAVAVGVPLATGLLFLRIFGEIKEQHLWDIPKWLPLLTSLLTFGSSALGIAYGALSTSWDAEKKGSLLGLEQAQENWVEMWREEDENNS
ncbi:hypothetical protein UlMin_024466 [Ulmus minor]